jgi:hypothetical protein
MLQGRDHEAATSQTAIGAVATATASTTIEVFWERLDGATTDGATTDGALVDAVSITAAPSFGMSTSPAPSRPASRGGSTLTFAAWSIRD